MNRHRNIHPADSRLRALLALALVLALEGCMTMSVSHVTSLPAAPAAQAQGPLPVPVAFIVRFSGSALAPTNTEHDFTLEAGAWRTALSRYAEPDHIYIAGDSAHEPLHKFQGFRATHPVVEIMLAYASAEMPVWRQLPEVMFNVLIMAAEIESLGLLPVPLSDEMSARFSITFPDNGSGEDLRPAQAGQPANPLPPQQYQFARSLWLAPLYFIPGGDEYSMDVITPLGAAELSHKELTEWRVEEKRRLLALYLSELRLRLGEYAQRTRTHTAATAARAP